MAERRFVYFYSFMLMLVQTIKTRILCLVNILVNLIYKKALNPIVLIEAISIIIFVQIALSPSFDLVQNVEAALPVSEITSADSEGTNIEEGISLTIQSGDTGRGVAFEFRGFDDNDGVMELQCNWDGGPYSQSNCSAVSPQTQATFTGPDGVTRLYNLRTGSASRELPPSTNTHTFGVQMLNSNFQLSQPVIRTFKIVQDSPPPTQDIDRRIKVHFDSIYIKDDKDHFGISSAKCCSGEWTLLAYVQGNIVPILAHHGNIDDGDTITFDTYNEIVVDLLKDQPQALSVMTLGYEDDTGFFQQCFKYYIPGGCGFCAPGIEDGANIRNILNTEAIDNWKQAILAYQKADKTCGDDQLLGFINDVYPGDTLGPGDHEFTSENGDFKLKFTISVGPYVAPPPVSQNHKVKVNFDSITVHNNHEGTGNGNGEYHLFAFVHGLGVDLAQATEFGVCGGNPAHCGGLWDVKSGQTLTFKPDTSISVDLPSTTPLSIFTIGEEVDSCSANFHDFLPDIRILAQKYPELGFTFFNNPYDWSVAQEKIYQFQTSERLTGYARCSFADDDEILGTINELYWGPGYDARPHEIPSTSGDFTLRYTVSVAP